MLYHSWSWYEPLVQLKALGSNQEDLNRWDCPSTFRSLSHATEGCDDPSGWQGDEYSRPLHNGSPPVGCQARTAGAELPACAPSPLRHGGLGHLAGHFDLSAASLGVGFSSAESRDEVPPGADGSTDWPDLHGGVVGAFPRPFGPGSRRRFSSEGLGQAGVGWHSYMDGIPTPVTHVGKQSGPGAIHDGYHRDPLRAPGPHPRPRHQAHCWKVCRNLHSLQIPPSTWDFGDHTNTLDLSRDWFRCSSLWFRTTSWS